MSDLETTELKLKSTATGGLEAHRSPYYRRLVSAGYKGFLQGSIGGAALYGLVGLAIAGVVALPLLAASTITGVAAASLIAASAGIGLLKGADTFGSIGSVAAINAESADLAEQRRYLLDRYYDIPEGHTGDQEREAIRQELLARQTDVEKPPFFHWKTLLIGAAVGGLIALAIFTVGLVPLGHTAFMQGLSTFIGDLGLAKVFGSVTTALTATGTTVGTIVGALTGATIGIDRYYIRKWFDHTDGVIHDSSHHETALMERHRQVERLRAASQEDAQTKFQLREAAQQSLAPEAATTAVAPSTTVPTSATIRPAHLENTTPAETKPAAKTPIASLDTPTHKVSNARRMGMMEIQKAMSSPAV